MSAMYFEDFEAGQEFVSQGRTITEADIVHFAGWSWDTNPVHTDSVDASARRFGAPIAHGLLGMSVAMGLASRLGIFESSSIALLGVDSWRFESPVIAGDTVHLRLTIDSARITSGGNAGILGRTFTLVNQRGETAQQGRIGLMVSLRQAGDRGFSA